MNVGYILNAKVRRQFTSAIERRVMTARLSSMELMHLQLAAIRERWRDAKADVPYYAALVSRGDAPEEIETWKDVSALPVLTRQILQDLAPQFVRKSHSSDSFVRTAGSTGTPLQIGMNRHERDLMRIVKLSEWQALGYQPTSRLFLIWGHSHLLGTGLVGRANHLKRKVTDALLGYQRVDAYRLGRESCLEYAGQLLHHRPIGVIGYASALDLFAKYTEHMKGEFRSLNLKFVLATAEPPPSEEFLERIEDLFGCPLVQEYGGAEFGQVAFKVGRGPFRVYGDLNYFEADASSGAGKGSALVTSLYQRYVPFFRYRVGDELAGPDAMPNGHVNCFDAVAGRLNDVIALPGGDSIHSVAIFHCIHQEASVQNIQMVLDDNGIEIALICRGGRDEQMEARIRARLGQVHPLLGGARLTFPDDLQTNRAGKRRWFVDNRGHSRKTAAR